MKKAKKFSEAHTPQSPKGMGDYYGTGIKNPMGRMREDYMSANWLSPKKLGTPPKSLA